MKPLRLTLAPLIIPLLPKRTFEFRGKRLACFYHRYNMTWAGERAVEIPIAQSYLDHYQGKRILEVGNVLSHYFPIRHEVLDKFEKGAGVINEDIIDFKPAKQYALIISISTFEHIGFDDEADERSDRKILRAIAACRNLLEPDGRLVLTVPIGYNPDLNRMIATGELGTTEESYLRRTSRLVWEPSHKEEALSCRFKTPYPYANAILVAEFSKPNKQESP